MIWLIEGGDYTAHRPGRFPLQTFDELNDPSQKNEEPSREARGLPSSRRPLIPRGGPWLAWQAASLRTVSFFCSPERWRRRRHGTWPGRWQAALPSSPFIGCPRTRGRSFSSLLGPLKFASPSAFILVINVANRDSFCIYSARTDKMEALDSEPGEQLGCSGT